MKNLVCFVALVALLSVVSAKTQVVNSTNILFFTNPACLGTPASAMAWTPIDPASNNCTLVTRFPSIDAPSAQYLSSDEACPATPNSHWMLESFWSDAGCSSDSGGSLHYMTGTCERYDDSKRGQYDASYFLSCLNDPPIRPFVQVQEVTSCREAAPVGPVVTRQAGAISGPTEAIFANTPGACLPYYNNSDPSPYGEFATYVKTTQECNPASTTTLDVAFYNDSSCTHLQTTVSLSLGCHDMPDLPYSVKLTCLADHSSSPEPVDTTPSTGASPNTPTGSASHLSLSIALVTLLVATLVVLM